MKENYGADAIFFDYTPGILPGTRVAVTAMTHGGLRTIFTNYNASSDIHRDSTISPQNPIYQGPSYVAIRPQEVEREPLTWQV